LLTVRLRSIFDEGLSPLINRRLDGLDGVEVIGRDIRLALTGRGVSFGALGASSGAAFRAISVLDA
jgi:hypothetical protein